MRDGVPWGAAQGILGTVDDGELPEMSRRRGGVEAHEDDRRRATQSDL